MAKMFTTPKRLLALLCASALLAAMPLSVTMDARTGVVALGSAVALADNDGGHDGNDGGHDGNDGGHDGNDHGTGGNGFDDNGYYQGGGPGSATAASAEIAAARAARVARATAPRHRPLLRRPFDLPFDPRYGKLI